MYYVIFQLRSVEALLVAAEQTKASISEKLQIAEEQKSALEAHIESLKR